MTGYVARRVAVALLTLWVVSGVAFILLRVAPGDAVVAAMALAPGESGLTQEALDARRHELGLDRPMARQYADWLAGLARLDAGRSSATGLPVIAEVSPRLGATAELAVVTFVFMCAAGFGLGIASAMARGGLADSVVRYGALAAMSAPAFWLGLIAVVAIASWTGVFVASSYVPFWQDPGRNLLAVAPAAATLAVRPAALLARVVRNAAVDAMHEDYVRTARAKGLAERVVVVRHALPPALLPSVTVAAAEAVFFLGGAVVIEQLFGIPGVGRALAAGVIERDYPLVQFLVLVFGSAAVVINLGTDLLYARLDPRVRLR
jgi:peptide/nickel transport system permease protein